MQPMLSHVAGIDIHKEKLTITAIIESQDGNTTIHQFESPTFTDDLIKTGLKLLDLGVTHVAMESTGIYWKPIHHVWKPLGLNITLGNATHLKNVPGRKTDMNDSHWIATLHRNGLIRPSYVPEQKYQELRMLTRHRQCLVDDASRLKNRAQKILEDGNIKLSSVISDVFGVAGRLILESIAQGDTDKFHLASLAKTNLKRKEDLPKALANTLTKTQCILIRQLLSQFDSIQLLIAEVEQEISNRLKEHSKLLEKLDEVPGIDRTIAQGIIAEATADMSSFKNDRFFAAWTGVAPGNNESANKKKRTKTRKGNPSLKKLLVQAANAAIKTKGSFFQAKHKRFTLQLGSYNKATVAIANHLARSIYHIIKFPDIRYKELGALRADSKDRQISRAIHKLRSLGVQIDFNTTQLIIHAKREVPVFM